MRRAVTAVAVVCALVVAATGCGRPQDAGRQQAKAGLVGKVVLAEAQAIDGQLHPLKVLRYDAAIDAFLVTTPAGQTAWVDAECLLTNVRAVADARPAPPSGP